MVVSISVPVLSCNFRFFCCCFFFHLDLTAKDDLPAAVTLAGLNSEEASTSEGLIEQELPNQDADAADPIGEEKANIACPV